MGANCFICDINSAAAAILFASICGIFGIFCYVRFCAGIDVPAFYAKARRIFSGSPNQNEIMRITLDDMCNKYKEVLKINDELRDKINFYRDELKITQTQLIKCADENAKMLDLIFVGDDVVKAQNTAGR